MGLYGLASYSAELRTKEIGIRKAFGASIPKIIGMLSRDYIKYMIIAFFISVPIANYFLREWLSHFSYRIEINWMVFFGSWILVTVIALVSVSGQSLKSASINPVDSLRDE